MKNRKIQVWLPLMLSAAMIGGMFMGYKMRDGIPGKSFFYMEKRRPVQEIIDLIQNKYVDEVNINQLADTAIQAILTKLDPHSSFIPANELARVNEDIQGSFYGIGIEFDIFDDTLNVVNVLKDGPGAKAGIRTGDKFLQTDKVTIAGTRISTDSIRQLLRGNRGTTVAIRLLRAGKIVELTVSRDIIPLTSIDAAYMIDREIGYIRLNKFSTQTYREFMESLLDLKKRGLKKLILDLRGNGGGVLEEAVEIADEFLEGDKLITYTEGKHTPRKEFRCRRQGQFEQGGLVLLADDGSASASEILLGALQDWDRATIVGRRSFGKGLVQEQFDLSDRSALRLTVARYYTPLGRSIQRPYENGGKAYYEEIGKRYTDGELYSADSVKNDTSKVYKTPKGKRLYGKGGITPDVFVAADTGKITETLTRLYAKGLINRFAYQFSMLQGNLTGQYKDPALFETGFQFTESYWNDFAAIASRDSVDINLLNEADKVFVKRSLKASIARQLWRNTGYFEVFNAGDETVKKAVESLQ